MGPNAFLAQGFVAINGVTFCERTGVLYGVDAGADQLLEVTLGGMVSVIANMELDAVGMPSGILTDGHGTAIVGAIAAGSLRVEGRSLP